jgi:hypothetical protein
MASCIVSTACLGYYSNHSNSTTVDAAVFDWQQCLTAFAWSVVSWRLAHVHDQIHVPKAPCACVSCAVLQAEHARRREAEQQLKVVKMQLVSEHTRPGRRGSKTITGEEGAITECAWTGGWGYKRVACTGGVSFLHVGKGPSTAEDCMLNSLCSSVLLPFVLRPVCMLLSHWVVLLTTC